MAEMIISLLQREAATSSGSHYIFLVEYAARIEVDIATFGLPPKESRVPLNAEYHILVRLFR